MDPKKQHTSLMFCGVCVLALLQLLFYNWVVLESNTPSYNFIIMWWLATGLGFFGFYGVGRIFPIDLPRNLRAAFFAIFGGATIGCTASMVVIAIIEPV